MDQQLNAQSERQMQMTGPVPAARPMSDFTVEQIGDELIIFDCETMQYHTLNQAAHQVWLLCDGTTSIAVIAQSLALPSEVVETTIAELGEASLLVIPAERWVTSLSRRRAIQLMAAGTVGAVGLPLVKSITVPDAASAVSPSLCRGACNSGGNCSQNLCPTGQTASCQPVDTGETCCVCT